MWSGSTWRRPKSASTSTCRLRKPCAAEEPGELGGHLSFDWDPDSRARTWLDRYRASKTGAAVAARGSPSEPVFDLPRHAPALHSSYVEVGESKESDSPTIAGCTASRAAVVSPDCSRRASCSRNPWISRLISSSTAVGES